MARPFGTIQLVVSFKGTPAFIPSFPAELVLSKFWWIWFGGSGGFPTYPLQETQQLRVSLKIALPPAFGMCRSKKRTPGLPSNGQAIGTCTKPHYLDKVCSGLTLPLEGGGMQKGEIPRYLFETDGHLWEISPRKRTGAHHSDKARLARIAEPCISLGDCEFSSCITTEATSVLL